MLLRKYSSFSIVVDVGMVSENSSSINNDRLEPIHTMYSGVRSDAFTLTVENKGLYLNSNNTRESEANKAM